MIYNSLKQSLNNTLLLGVAIIGSKQLFTTYYSDALTQSRQPTPPRPTSDVVTNESNHPPSSLPPPPRRPTPSRVPSDPTINPPTSIGDPTNPSRHTPTVTDIPTILPSLPSERGVTPSVHDPSHHTPTNPSNYQPSHQTSVVSSGSYHPSPTPTTQSKHTDDPTLSHTVTPHTVSPHTVSPQSV